MKENRHCFIKNNYKCFIAIFLIVVSLIIIGSCFAEASIPSATKSFYVNDFGDVFNDTQEEEMMKRAVNLAYKPEGVQVVVSTVKTLNGLSVEDYANMMYNKYKIGKDDKGILILLSIQERKIRVEVGYGLESLITDSKAGDYIRTYGIDYLRNNQFDLGLIAIQKAIVGDLDAYYEKVRATEAPKVRPTDVPITRSNPISEKEPVVNNDNAKGSDDVMVTIFTIGIIALLIAIIILSYILAKNKKRYNRERSSLNEELGNAKDSIEYYRNLNYELNGSLEKFKSSYDKLKQNYDYLKERFTRAKKLNPNLDKEIDAMIQREVDEKNREIALQFDSKYSDLESTRPLNECLAKGYNGYEAFEKKYKCAFSEYKSLSKEQRGYVSINMDEVYKRYKEGMVSKSQEDAKRLNASLESCVNEKRGTESNLPAFDKLQKEYNRMDDYTKGLVNAALITSLNKLIFSAKKEKEERLERERIEEERRRRRREEEEEERRRRDSYSSSSFDSSSSFGGFGGSSGGGGASSNF